MHFNIYFLFNVRAAEPPLWKYRGFPYDEDSMDGIL